MFDHLCPSALTPIVLQIWDFLALLRQNGIKIRSFEVYLIQLPRNAVRRRAKLKEISERLSDIGVRMTRPPIARTRKAVPSDGFELPALVHLCAPAPIQDAIMHSIWDSVW